MQTFLIGLLLILGGGTLIYFNKQLEENMGRVDWAEKNIGGTYAMYVLIGFGLVVLGILIWFGFSGGDGSQEFGI